jgi:hypothetical protein
MRRAHRRPKNNPRGRVRCECVALVVNEWAAARRAASTARQEIEQLAGDPPTARPSRTASRRQVRPAKYSRVGECLQRGPGRLRADTEEAGDGCHIQAGVRNDVTYQSVRCRIGADAPPASRPLGHQLDDRRQGGRRGNPRSLQSVSEPADPFVGTNSPVQRQAR